MAEGSRDAVLFSRRAVLAAAAGLAVCSAMPATAAEPEPDLTRLFAVTTALYGIPPALLYAIALQESGRRQAPGRPVQPWPWTLNVGGEGQRFASHTAAWDGICRALERRPLPRNIDVGMMQVSWPYNLPRLTDLYLALDPQENLRAGALVLRANFDRCGDWWTATGWYHSPRPARAADYRARVRGHYRRLVAADDAGGAERTG